MLSSCARARNLEKANILITVLAKLHCPLGANILQLLELLNCNHTMPPGDLAVGNQADPSADVAQVQELLLALLALETGHELTELAAALTGGPLLVELHELRDDIGHVAVETDFGLLLEHVGEI